jgi:hypothetical protein
MANGAVWAIDRGARILNMSYAGTAGSSALLDAIRYARGKGGVVVASAGNAGTSTPQYPAAYSRGAQRRGDRHGRRADELLELRGLGGCGRPPAATSRRRSRRAPRPAPSSSISAARTPRHGGGGHPRPRLSARPGAPGPELEQAVQSSAVPMTGGVARGRADAAGTLAALGGRRRCVHRGTGLARRSVGVGADRRAAPAVLAPGTALGASPGGWTGDRGLNIAYQWHRLRRQRRWLLPDHGATGRTYTLTTSDSASTVRVKITASKPERHVVCDLGGHGRRRGDAARQRAREHVAPVISGTSEAGQTLTVSTAHGPGRRRRTRTPGIAATRLEPAVLGSSARRCLVYRDLR